MLECVINLSEGRHTKLVDAIAAAAGEAVLDVHSDADHHRSVVTLAGPEVERASRQVTTDAIAAIDIGAHRGAHPRLGAVDVVPFVPLEGSGIGDALEARDSFAAWAGETLGLPCFLYGPERSLPQVRYGAFVSITPDSGPPAPHPTAGACAVGARLALVAYNLMLPALGIAEARRLATSLRGPSVRALAFEVGAGVQLSFNLLEPESVGPAQIYDAVSTLTPVAGAELVGLIPSGVLESVPQERWGQLDLDRSRTIEARLARSGLSS